MISHGPIRAAACCVALFLLGVFPATAFAASAGSPVIRRPVGPGRFYPADAAQLSRDIKALYAAAPADPPAGKLVACIVPHSPYEYCGAVIAAAFAPIQPGQFDRVIILGPSHYAPIEGVSIPLAGAFATPLGAVPVDGDAVRQLSFSPLVTLKDLRYGGKSQARPIHEIEHCIEVVLPFLQERLGEFRLVPILVGSLKDATGKYDPASAAALGDRIRALMDARTLLVVSSDFTHSGAAFEYTPVRDPSIEALKEIDRPVLGAICGVDIAGFEKLAQKAGSNVCGQNAIDILLNAIPRRSLGVLAEHRLSAEVNKDFGQCIAFAAVQFFDFGRTVRVPAPKPVDEEKKAKGPAVTLTNAGGDLRMLGHAAPAGEPAKADAAPKLKAKGGVFYASPADPEGKQLMNDLAGPAGLNIRTAMPDAKQLPPAADAPTAPPPPQATETVPPAPEPATPPPAAQTPGDANAKPPVQAMNQGSDAAGTVRALPSGNAGGARTLTNLRQSKATGDAGGGETNDQR